MSANILLGIDTHVQVRLLSPDVKPLQQSQPLTLVPQGSTPGSLLLRLPSSTMGTTSESSMVGPLRSLG